MLLHVHGNPHLDRCGAALCAAVCATAGDAREGIDDIGDEGHEVDASAQGDGNDQPVPILGDDRRPRAPASDHTMLAQAASREQELPHIELRDGRASYASAKGSQLM